MDTSVAGVDTKSSTGLIRPTKWSSEQGKGNSVSQRRKNGGSWRTLDLFFSRKEFALLCKDERINKDPNQSTCVIHLRTVIWLYKLYNYISYESYVIFLDSSDSKFWASDLWPWWESLSTATSRVQDCSSKSLWSSPAWEPMRQSCHWAVTIFFGGFWFDFVGEKGGWLK